MNVFNIFMSLIGGFQRYQSFTPKENCCRQNIGTCINKRYSKSVIVSIKVLLFGGGVVQWVARLTRDRWIPVSREFEPRQRPPLFP